MNKKEVIKVSTSTFRNRSRLEIIAELLEYARQGAPKMHLVYGAKLSHRLGSAYINYLLSDNLIEIDLTDDRRKIYKTSKQGLKYLETYENLNRLTFGQASRTIREPAKERLAVQQASGQVALVQVPS